MRKRVWQTVLLIALSGLFWIYAEKGYSMAPSFLSVYRLSPLRDMPKPDEVLYEMNIGRLDSLLDKQGKREASAKNYEEIIWSDYQFGQTYGGKMSVSYRDNELFSFVMEIGETESVIKTSQKYEYRRLEDGSLWFCVWDSEDRKVDLPDYLVNEAVLKYYASQEIEETEGESTSWEGKKRYDGFSPYEKTPEYYAAEFWLIQSGPNGYEPIRLTDTVEYMGDSLTLLEIDFVEKDILQLYYFVGRSPWTTAMHQFQYNGQDGFDFYRSVYREMTDSMLINDRKTLGQMSMYDFFHDIYTRIPASKRGDEDFAIDQETGNRIEVTEILDMDEFLEIVEEWAKEEGMTYLKKRSWNAASGFAGSSREPMDIITLRRGFC